MGRAYFSNLPRIQYGNVTVTNILANARMVPTALQNASSFYPYTCKDGDTPEIVAFNYYGSIDYVWLVLFSNNIIDITTQWFKTNDQFNAYMTELYGSVPNAMASIHHYANSTDPTYPQVTPLTYSFLSGAQQQNLVPVYAYDWFAQINHGRRNIQLVGKSYASQIALELEKVFNS